MPAGRATANPVIPCRFPTSAEIMFALHPGEKLLTSARKFRNTAQWNFHSPPCHLAKTYLIIEWTLTSQKQGMGNDWRFLHKETDQNLQGTLAGYWEFSRFKKTIRPLSYGSIKLLPPPFSTSEKVLTHKFHASKYIFSPIFPSQNSATQHPPIQLPTNVKNVKNVVEKVASPFSSRKQ